ncbi:hypothetical protein ACIBEF_13305 [Micromonospora sp. NPDC050795]|uniref:hypothetical protein n=1 Tax=Micromonospora sp. NPDC050795 TaxID=3364282 RepID=UPI0037BBE28C
MGKARQKKRRGNLQTPRFEITVVLGVGHGEASLDAEVEIAKSAVLYADHVRIASPRLFAVIAAMELSTVTPQTLSKALKRAVRHGGDTLRPVAEDAQAIWEALDALPPRHALTAAERKEKTALLRNFNQGLEGLRTTARRNLDECLATPLIPAINAGLISLDPLVSEEESFDDLPDDLLLQRYVDRVKSTLADQRTYPLFDATTAHLADLGVEAGEFSRSNRFNLRALNAASGTGLVERLPSFDGADMSEIVDIRKELDAPLARFRRSVEETASDLPESPADPDFEPSLDHLWLTKVSPAIEEIRERVQQDASLRRLSMRALPAAAGQVAAVGGLSATGLAIAAASHPNYIWAALAASVSVGPTIASVASERSRALNQAQNMPFYFLYRSGVSLERRRR